MRRPVGGLRAIWPLLALCSEHARAEALALTFDDAQRADNDRRVRFSDGGTTFLGIARGLKIGVPFSFDAWK